MTNIFIAPCVHTGSRAFRIWCFGGEQSPLQGTVTARAFPTHSVRVSLRSTGLTALTLTAGHQWQLTHYFLTTAYSIPTSTYLYTSSLNCSYTVTGCRRDAPFLFGMGGAVLHSSLRCGVTSNSVGAVFIPPQPRCVLRSPCLLDRSSRWSERLSTAGAPAASPSHTKRTVVALVARATGPHIQTYTRQVVRTSLY